MVPARRPVTFRGSTLPFLKEHGELYGANGYAILEFDGASLTEFVVAPDGRALRTQTLC
jgi:hypothetical protein